MDELWLIGRILVGLLFVGSGIGYLADFSESVRYAESKNAPAAPAAVVGTSLAFLVGGASIILGLWGDLGALLLIVTLIPVTFMAHQFWRETDPLARQMEIAGFMKNIALIGAAVRLFQAFARDTLGRGLPYTMTEGVFSFTS